MTLTRKLFMAFCIAAIVVMAYYLLYHQVCLEEMSELNREKMQFKDYGTRKNIDQDHRQRHVQDLDEETGKLEQEIQLLRSSLDCTIYQLRDEVYVSAEFAPGVPGPVGFDVEPTCDIARNYNKEDTLSFEITSNFDGIRKFFERMHNLKGMLLSWYLEPDETGELMNLWMEIAP